MKNSTAPVNVVPETQALLLVAKLPQPIKNLIMATGIGAATIAGSPEAQSATLLPFTKSIISGAEALNLPENSSRNVLNAR